MADACNNPYFFMKSFEAFVKLSLDAAASFYMVTRVEWIEVRDFLRVPRSLMTFFNSEMVFST